MHADNEDMHLLTHTNSVFILYANNYYAQICLQAYLHAAPCICGMCMHALLACRPYKRSAAPLALISYI